MELEQKFTEDRYYDISDEFMDSMEALGIRTSVLIAKQIEDCVILVPSEDLATHSVGGIIDDPIDGPTPFAIEILRIDDEAIMLTDITLISMDEYLDLINLNLYFKSNKEL
jgi:hypothetical protein|tara:strand:- start:996 stop:1328 length:333 start_codon:yes stop_codon:yes gene_type:complete